MWFIPTRNRPTAMMELISSMQDTGCVPECAVMIDGEPEAYKDVPWPAHWHIHSDTSHLEVVRAVNALFALYPHEKSYGFLTDHARPRSMRWAEDMEASAEDWSIVLCEDGHNRLNPRNNYRRMTAASCFGGELCRMLGWVWPDMFVHFYGDDAWEDIGHELGIVIWRKDIKVDDLLASKGQFPKDDNNKRLWRGEPFADKDAAAYVDIWLRHKEAVITSLKAKIPPQPVTVACVKWGDKYSADYVNILFDMVSRNLRAGYRGKFVCFTDDPSGIDEGIEIHSLPLGIEGWWNKLYLFKHGIFADGERVVYLDLDTVISGACDGIFNYRGQFAILQDFYRPDGYGSGMMMWRGGYGAHIWESWLGAEKPILPGGDQEWIERQIEDADILQELYPNAILSYKAHCWEGIPKGAKIINFHGTPKPHECDGWVPQVWKIGGGTSLEMEIICNVDESEIVRNIRHSLTLPLPWLKMQPAHEGHAVIVGGAPSLESEIESIRARHEHAQTIFSTNGAWGYLAKHGIAADCQIILDARRENAEFVPWNFTLCYLASQCHPDVIEKTLNPILWHSAADGIQEIIGHNTGDPLVGGGVSVGLKAIGLAWALGYRNFHLYGFDSCYAASHHAYEQKLNDGARVFEVQCNGRRFNVAGWMVTQADQFKEMVMLLKDDGCKLTVHGDGLIPWIAEEMGVQVLVASASEKAYNHTNILLNRKEAHA